MIDMGRLWYHRTRSRRAAIVMRLSMSWVFLMLCPRHSAHAQVVDGFLQYRWGTPLTEMREKLELRDGTQEGDAWQYACNIRSIGGADLEDCDLEFKGGTFSGVIITTSGPKNSHRFLDFLKALYGEGRREANVAYQWLTPSTHISYDEDSAGDAYIYWYDLKSGNGDGKTIAK